MDADDLQCGHKGSKVYLMVDGRVCEMPWETGRRFLSAFAKHVAAAEEFAQVHRIITDGAILQRAGFPIGLTNNPYIQREIYKKAQLDEKLRRYMPTPGIRSAEVFGTPKIYQPITPEQLLAAMNDKERAIMRARLNEEE